MAWPPPPLPINRSNATPQQDTHPADHNAIALAINDLVGQVQFIDAGVRRYGVILAQSGQIYTAGQVATLGWSARSDATWGGGAVLTVPAGQAGGYVVNLRVAGPDIPVDNFADVIIYMKGSTYTAFIPPGKATVAVTAMALLDAGDTIYVQIYNPRAEAQFYNATMTILRVVV